MAVEHAMFKFEDLKVNSRDDRQNDRMTTKCIALAHAYTCGETNYTLNPLRSSYAGGYQCLVNSTLILINLIM